MALTPEQTRALNQKALDTVLGTNFVKAGDGRGDAALNNFATAQQIAQYNQLRQAWDPGYNRAPNPAPTGNAQLDEATRQVRLEMQRYQTQLNANTAEADRQLTAAQVQANAQNAQSVAWQNVYNQQLQSQEQKRQEAENAALSAAAAQQAQREAEARQRAENMRVYTEGRTARTDQLNKDIGAAYAGFDDNYFSQFAKDFINYYNPQIADQAKEAEKRLTFKYANQGGIDSSAFIGELDNLRKSRLAEEKKLAANAASSSAAFRTDIDSQRRSLLSEALSAANIGPEVLPDGVDAGTSLERITAALTPYANLAKQRAATITTPSYSSMGNLFSDYAGGGGQGGGTATSTLNGSNLYQPKAGGSSRVVV